ncbi:protein huluwa isoform X1 [Tachysurus fulvidraco]|uniref:protein huluwa isoform X1 n=1 Tax=Tachysurus fulvidraco TaxID=1234273 RepID=UPI000F4FA307|nr:protein huluwa isoform X1 [Tachysurus fulvidraco]
MSQSETAVPSPELRESLQVSSLTLLVLVLIPCVVLLLLLNCLLLGYKLLQFARGKRARYGSESVLLNSSTSLSTRQRIARFNDDASYGPVRKTKYASVSEPMLAPPITSSLSSSAERRAACGQRCRSEALARPDGATYAGSGSLRVPSTLLGASGSRAWRRSAPMILQSSDSEIECENVAPPNSPEQLVTQIRHGSLPVMMRRSSTVELELVSLDKVHLEGELISSIPQETSCFIASTSTSAAGPGLDSDFGASAGVSLRILSADSDGFPGATWASGLEWDYYDPSYVTQNHVPKHRHHAPPITTKQYWV